MTPSTAAVLRVDRPSGGPPAIGRFLAPLLLAACALGVVLERVHTYAEPPERDIAGYAVIAHEMALGRHLYSDLWERKPPLLYATFGVAERLVGYGPGEVFLVNAAAALATLGGCYAAGRAFGGTATAGLAAAALWTLLGGDPWLQANQPNAEVFVNAALTGAAAALFRPDPRWRRAGLAVGGLFTVASMFEQHVIVTCATLVGGYLVAGGRARLARRAAAMAAAAAVGAVAWGAMAGYFAAVGRLPAATDVLFHQLWVGGSLTSNLARSFWPEHLYPRSLTWVGPIAALMVVAAVIGRSASPCGASDDRPWWTWVGWAAGTWLVVALPGNFFAHYYQLWLPPMCVAGGWAAGRLLWVGRGVPRLVRLTAVVAVTALLAGRELPPYAWPPDVWSTRKYENQNFVEQAYLGRRLAAMLRPDETFWVCGSDNTLYFASRRSPVTGLLFLEPLIDDPHTSGWARLVADLERSRPPLILVRKAYLAWIPRRSPVPAWVADHYEPIAANLSCSSYAFWVRRGDDDLTRRLADPPPAPPFGGANAGEGPTPSGSAGIH